MTKDEIFTAVFTPRTIVIYKLRQVITADSHGFLCAYCKLKKWEDADMNDFVIAKVVDPPCTSPENA